MLQQNKHGRWIAVREPKPFSQTKFYKGLVVRGKKTGLTITIASGDDVICFQSDNGIIFNDTLDYDLLNHTEDRKEVIRECNRILKHYKLCKKQAGKS